ncbi:potassium transporter Kup [Aquabacterium sp. CECT 9606]|uniref:potassium transporter Kup n=1 Tax=Aquabacterium sp. CECT 9606 TaxID=2845822 RepID=UPI001E2EF141|nr:potassium transporter Kup [Aquabacterium sp. CECT 9606]CAH0354595.1 Low affinity potassium transport system protein kup [Aquabacterium sp. CECT 9606]
MSSNPQGTSRLSALTLAALGIVFGDIGTSPLYAFKEAFSGPHGMPATPESVLATLSALLWAVVIIISLKYVWVVLKYDNDGEGGVLALTALAHRLTNDSSRRSILVISAGVFAAALFYGDAIITPAISVLSAVEGISIATPRFEHFIVPITIGILVGLFLIQKHGTGSVGKLFGPVTVLWFLSLAALGGISIAQTPEVLQALNPMHAIRFAIDRPPSAFLLLSAVFLGLTGGEALYADMGHFGAKAVRLAWYGLVFPSLIINYFGQGALVLRDASAVSNPFFLMAPSALLIPLVILATAATVIASQATISGAYSMTLQASRLGYMPRIRILHTSDKEKGQIYIPSVNWLMLLAVILLVMSFKSSGALAAAYGIAVSGTMIITTLLTAFVTLISARVMRLPILAALGLFGVLELGFFASNLTKLGDGGWFPLALGAAIFLMLTTWKRGSQLVADQRRKIDIPMVDFLEGPMPDVPRVAGTAVYLTSDPTIVPSALFHNLKHYKVMHRQTVFLHVVNENTPYVSDSQRLEVLNVAPGFFMATVRFGFREEPDIPQALALLQLSSLDLNPMSTTFFVARSTIADGPGALPAWRCALYGWMTRQAEGAATYYRLPANQVVELGTQVML